MQNLTRSEFERLVALQSNKFKKDVSLRLAHKKPQVKSSRLFMEKADDKRR